jgi:hypothetical protein
MAEKIPREDLSLKLDHTKLGERLAEQAQEIARQERAKQKAFATGAKRYTEGK